VLRLRHDVEPRGPEQARHALTEQDGVICQRHPDRVGGLGHDEGSSTRRRVPFPRGLSTNSAPPTAETRSKRPRRPEPRDGSAPPTPSSTTSTTRWPSRRSARTVTDDACAYFWTFWRASLTA